MKHTLRAALFAPLLAATAVLGAMPVHAMPCDGLDLGVREAVQEVLTGAENPQMAKWASYMNERFYVDLTCKLGADMTAEDVLRLKATPEVLLERAMAMSSDMGASDPFAAILTGMQGEG